MNAESKCYKCYKPGHFARECTQESGEGASMSKRGGRYNNQNNNNSSVYNRNLANGSGSASGDKSDFGAIGANPKKTLFDYQEQQLEDSMSNMKIRGNHGSSGNRCYRCNKTGHFARDCKETAERCYRCNKSGHHAKDCDTEVQSGSCYNCAQVGHLQRECPKGTSKSCYKCKEIGHLARDCNESESDDDRTCYNCGKGGHISRDCPESGLNRAKEQSSHK